MERRRRKGGGKQVHNPLTNQRDSEKRHNLGKNVSGDGFSHPTHGIKHFYSPFSSLLEWRKRLPHKQHFLPLAVKEEGGEGICTKGLDRSATGASKATSSVAYLLLLEIMYIPG